MRTGPVVTALDLEGGLSYLKRHTGAPMPLDSRGSPTDLAALEQDYRIGLLCYLPLMSERH